MWLFKKKNEIQPLETTFVCDECKHVVDARFRYTVAIYEYMYNTRRTNNYCKQCKPEYDVRINYRSSKKPRFFKREQIDEFLYYVEITEEEKSCPGTIE